MKRYLSLLWAIAIVLFSASTCEKMEPGDYKDFTGTKINAFHVVDANTLSSEEKVSANSSLVNIFTRFEFR